ncbi:hypothetical protein MRB53_028112 [Persea americana]|uniref:Uncharacterized protein n=1 Tax=Persea americana TaxID=3435 RepID=A0ACC2KEP5_PERAE|nr:hypothetical protein MRB53_028112 [Persea americana]
MNKKKLILYCKFPFFKNPAHFSKSDVDEAATLRLPSFTPKRRNEQKREISTLPNYGFSLVFPYLPEVMSSFELFGPLQCDDYLLHWTNG